MACNPYSIHRYRVPENQFDIFDFVSLVRATCDFDSEIDFQRPSVLYDTMTVHCPLTFRPPSSFPNRQTLCLDLDDTMTLMSLDRIRHEKTGHLIPYDTIVTAHENPEDWGYVYFRPYLRTFLAAVSKCFEVVVFTAACKEYADQILDAIDPQNVYIHHRLYRNSCQECVSDPTVPEAKVYIKDLRVLGRDLSKTILVDNSVLCFSYQLDSGIVCNPFRGRSDDRELMNILEVLIFVTQHPEIDVRRIFRKMYGLPSILDEYADCGGRLGLQLSSKLEQSGLIDINAAHLFSPENRRSGIARTSSAEKVPTGAVCGNEKFNEVDFATKSDKGIPGTDHAASSAPHLKIYPYRY